MRKSIYVLSFVRDCSASACLRLSSGISSDDQWLISGGHCLSSGWQLLDGFRKFRRRWLHCGC